MRVDPGARHGLTGPSVTQQEPTATGDSDLGDRAPRLPRCKNPEVSRTPGQAAVPGTSQGKNPNIYAAVGDKTQPPLPDNEPPTPSTS